MDRKIFKLPFTKEKIPEWICPTCKKGVLHLKDGTFSSEESSLSKSAHNHEAWEPEWIQLVYSCLIECSNSSCKEIIASSGSGTVDWDVTYDHMGNPEQEYFSYFKPKYFQPHLKLFDYPETTPDDVADEIDQSFALFFCNPSSASNHIRIAIEHLLTHLKVKRFERNGKLRPLNLHRRIELIPEKHRNLKELLFAIKWLGNAGSHANKEVSNDDVMDAYEILDVVLHEIYESKHREPRNFSFLGSSALKLSRTFQ